VANSRKQCPWDSLLFWLMVSKNAPEPVCAVAVPWPCSGKWCKHAQACAVANGVNMLKPMPWQMVKACSSPGKQERVELTIVIQEHSEPLAVESLGKRFKLRDHIGMCPLHQICQGISGTSATHSLCDRTWECARITAVNSTVE
jgi:hypothetical protein